MSTTTPNYNFIKPEITDVADITTPNGNWDILDNTLTELETGAEDVFEELENHTTNKNNPHEVTAEQVMALPLPDLLNGMRQISSINIDTISPQLVWLNCYVNSSGGGTYPKPLGNYHMVLIGAGESGKQCTHQIAFIRATGEVFTRGRDSVDVAWGTWNKYTPTASDVGARASTWTPSASDIPSLDASKIGSGTLAVARGGTGQTSLQATRNAMGLGNTTGALPVANGGTGQTTLALARNAMGLGNTTGALPVANGGTGTNTLDPAVTTVGARNIYAGTGAMTAGSTALTTGRIYLQYE